MANGDDSEVAPRFAETITLTTQEDGRVVLKLFDRINVDDVFLHLVNRELFRIITGTDESPDVNSLFKDFLLKERFTAGQG